MKSAFMRNFLKQGIIISLIISLTISPVFGLEGGSGEKDDASAEPRSISTEEAEPEQAYEKSANSWRYQDGALVTDAISAAPLLFASFTPWEWSDADGGYLSSDGSVIEGAIRKGVDVSSWQGKIDWGKVKASGIGFAIIRCGYGDDMTSQDDKYWVRNVQQCEAYGIPYGVYIYSYAEKDSQATSEANHVLRCLAEAGAEPDYPIYYDLEDKVVEACGKKAIVRRANIFCEAIEAKGYRAGVYASLSWWDKYLYDSSLDQYDKWIAQWNSTCQYEGKYRLWQCTSDGSVPGIDGRVDVNFEFPMDGIEIPSGSWVTNADGQTVFQKADGVIASSEWITYKGQQYYVDAVGQKAEGFVVINDSKYSFKGGVMQKDKWVTVAGKKYRASSDGRILTGYKKVGNYYYGFDDDGAMLTGTKKLNGKKYTFMSDGKAYLYKVKTTAKLNYRTGASSKKTRKGTYRKGKELNIIRKHNGWGQMPNGYWVKLSYTKNTVKYPEVVLYKAKTTSKVNYRTGASVSYKKKGSYQKGTVLRIRAEKNGWGQMRNGYWVKLSYTKRI